MLLTKQQKLPVEQVLSDWRKLPITEQPILLKTFSDGLNHQTHLISSGDQKTVLKLFTKPSPYAIAIQNLASSQELSPKVLYSNHTSDIALMEYINTETISQPVTEQDISLLGKTLKRLHTLSDKQVIKETERFDLLNYYATYLAEIDLSDPLIQTTHQQLLPIISLFLEDKTDWCICHNDLVKENCFINNSSVQFIDWEYAQVNNPWFDLITVIYSLDLDQHQVSCFIQSYQPDWLKRINTRFYYAALCAMLWCDILWHLARGKNLQQPELNKKFADLELAKNNFNLL